MKYLVHFLGLLILLFLPTQARTETGDRVRFGEDIVVEADEVVTDAVCIGCSIRVRGTVSGDAVAIGGGIEIDGTVGVDAVAVGGGIEIDGTVGVDAVAIGGGIEINGPVGVDAVAVGGDIHLGAGAAVGGDVVSAGGRIDRDPLATVGGEVSSSPGLPVAGLGGLLLLGLLVCAVFNLVLVLLSYLIAGEQRVETVAGTVRARAGLALLTGVGVLVGAVILFIISSLLGPVTPILAILVSVALVMTLVLGYTGLSSWLGSSLAHGSSPLVAVLLGALLITLLQLIPVLCFLTFPLFVLLALGSAALSGFGTATDWLPQQFAARPAVPPVSPPPMR